MFRSIFSDQTLRVTCFVLRRTMGKKFRLGQFVCRPEATHFMQELYSKKYNNNNIIVPLCQNDNIIKTSFLIDFTEGRFRKRVVYKHYYSTFRVCIFQVAHQKENRMVKFCACQIGLKGIWNGSLCLLQFKLTYKAMSRKVQQRH